jgi:hypothetical protein
MDRRDKPNVENRRNVRKKPGNSRLETSCKQKPAKNENRNIGLGTEIASLFAAAGLKAGILELRAYVTL